MHMVKMVVVKIVHMAVMANRGVSAVWAALMGVVGMALLGAGDHDTLSSISNFNRDCPLPLFCSVLYRALHHAERSGQHQGRLVLTGQRKLR